jgi:hypothetical protein
VDLGRSGSRRRPDRWRHGNRDHPHGDHHPLRETADRFARNDRPVIEQIMAGGAVSLRAIGAELNARGIRTARGGVWEAMTVRNLLQRV